MKNRIAEHYEKMDSELLEFKNMARGVSAASDQVMIQHYASVDEMATVLADKIIATETNPEPVRMKIAVPDDKIDATKRGIDGFCRHMKVVYCQLNKSELNFEIELVNTNTMEAVILKY